MTSSNNNINNLVNQIIFPPDMELRKIRKKKKKKSDSKKKAKEALKEALKDYDTALDTAKQEKVNLPQKLGVLPTALPQINSIREMNDLAQDLRGRVQEINSLIEEKRDEPTPEELRMIRLRKLMGLPEPSIPPLEASIPPSEASSIPYNPLQPQLMPVPSISALSADQQSEISNIETEIMESQNPAERAKLETRLKILERARKAREEREKEAQAQRKLKEQLSDPSQFITTNLQKDGQGNFTDKVIVPVGFDELWNQIRMLYENIIFDFTQGQVGMKGDEYRLDELKFEDLKKNQEKLRGDFNNYLEGLNPLQKEFLERKIFPTESGTARQFLGEMRNILDTDFKTQFIEHLKSIGVQVNPQNILIGSEKTPFQEKAQQQELKDDELEKEKKDYQNKLFKIRQKFTDFQVKKVNPIKAKGQGTSEEINTLLSDLEKIKTELDELNLREPKEIIKEIYLADYNEAEGQYGFIRNDLVQLLPPPEVQPPPFSPPPPLPPDQPAPPPFDDTPPPDYERATVEQKNAYKLLTKFVKNPGTWDKDLKEAVKVLDPENKIWKKAGYASKGGIQVNKDTVVKVLTAKNLFKPRGKGRPSKIPDLAKPVIEFIKNPKARWDGITQEAVSNYYIDIGQSPKYDELVFKTGKPGKFFPNKTIRDNLRDDLIKNRGIPESEFPDKKQKRLKFGKSGSLDLIEI